MIADARSLSPQDYLAAKRQVIANTHAAERQRRDDADAARLRGRYPDLARAADVAAADDYRQRIRSLVAAEATMNEAASAKQAASKEPSLYARELASERLNAAVAAHDEILRDVIQRHAASSQSERVQNGE